MVHALVVEVKTVASAITARTKLSLEEVVTGSSAVSNESVQ